MDEFCRLENEVKANSKGTVGIVKVPHLLLPLDVVENNDVEVKIIGISEREIEIDCGAETYFDKIVVCQNQKSGVENVHIGKENLDLAFKYCTSRKIMCYVSDKGALCYIKLNDEEYIVIACIEVKDIAIEKMLLNEMYKPNLLSFF